MFLVTDGDAREMVSRCLTRQLGFYYSKKNNPAYRSGIASVLDLLGMVVDSTSEVDEALVEEIALRLTHLQDIEEIAEHACVVACGMGQRPSRPDRPVPFRPFSSRDAHIMLQLKRTLELSKGASGPYSNRPSPLARSRVIPFKSPRSYLSKKQETTRPLLSRKRPSTLERFDHLCKRLSRKSGTWRPQVG